MNKEIKLTVSSGWANGDHVEYIELPNDWDEFTEAEKERYLDDCAIDYLHDFCEAWGEVVDKEGRLKEIK